tara:strand:- start:39 stop:221 length:183 start_codon:yes stop_codon:yes gene_type:complete
VDRWVAAVLAALHEVSGGFGFDAVNALDCQRLSRCYERCLIDYAELAGYTLAFPRKPSRQ